MEGTQDVADLLTPILMELLRGEEDVQEDSLR